MSRLLKQKSCPDVSVTEGVDSDPGHTEPIFETEFSSQLPIAWKDRSDGGTGEEDWRGCVTVNENTRRKQARRREGQKGYHRRRTPVAGASLGSALAAPQNGLPFVSYIASCS